MEASQPASLFPRVAFWCASHKQKSLSLWLSTHIRLNQRRPLLQIKDGIHFSHFKLIRAELIVTNFNIKVKSAVLLLRPCFPQLLLPCLRPNHYQLTLPCQMYNERIYIFNKMYFWSEHFFLICNPVLIIMVCAPANLFLYLQSDAYRLFCENVKNKILNSMFFFPVSCLKSTEKLFYIHLSFYTVLT